MQEGNGVARAGRYEKNALYYVVHNMLLLLWFQRKKNTTHAHNAILQFILKVILVQILQSCLKPSKLANWLLEKGLLYNKRSPFNY